MDGLTRQNVGLRIEHRKLSVPGAPTAKAQAVIRNLGPVDAVDIIVTEAPPGNKFSAYAVQNMSAPYGQSVKLADLTVKDDGTVDTAAQLRFFDSGFTNVVLVAPGQVPSAARMVGVSVRLRPVGNN